MARKFVNYFAVSLRLPDGTTAEEAREYIADAIRGWKGGLSPDHPMWNLKNDSVRVTRIVEE